MYIYMLDIFRCRSLCLSRCLCRRRCLLFHTKVVEIRAPSGKRTQNVAAAQTQRTRHAHTPPHTHTPPDRPLKQAGLQEFKSNLQQFSNKRIFFVFCFVISEKVKIKITTKSQRVYFVCAVNNNFKWTQNNVNYTKKFR